MSCPNHPQWPHSREDCPLCQTEKTNFNPALNKFETRNLVIEDLLNLLARKIQGELPEGWRFSLFLFQQDPSSEGDANIFYAASAQTSELLPLIEEWARRQVQ